MTSRLKYLTLIFIFILFLYIFLSFGIFAYSQDISPKNDIELGAKSAILIDANTGQILFQKNPDVRCYPASTTKILTALVALSKEKNLQRKLYVSKKAIMIEPGSSSYYLTEGETISFIDALYAMLLVSANDVANVIAENIGGDINNFVNEMNKYAHDLGAYNSHFTNPNGLHNSDHYVTAYDWSLIAKEAYKNPVIRKIVSTEEYKVISATHHNKPDTQLIFNINKLIRKNSKYYYPFANGMKTGYTTQAKRTLMASAKKDDIELIAIILSSDDAFADAIKLFDYGFNNYKKKQIFKANQIIGKIKIDNKNDGWIDTYIKDPYYILSNNTIKSSITYKAEYLKNLNIPLKKDTVVGSVYLYSYNHLITTLPIFSFDDYQPISNVKKSIQTIKQSIFPWVKWILLVTLIIIIALILFILFTIFNIRKRKSRLRLKSTKTIDFSSITKKVK